MARVSSATDMRSSEAASSASGERGAKGNAPDDIIADDRRSWQRFMLESPARITLQVPGCDDFEKVKLVDVSLGGFRLYFDHDLPAGSEIAIDHPTAGTMRGRLAWQSDDHIGIHMLEDSNRRTYLLRLISMILHSEVRVSS